MLLETIQHRHGVMELNKTVLHFLEICPHWGLVWNDVIVTQGCLQDNGREMCWCSVFKCHFKVLG